MLTILTVFLFPLTDDWDRNSQLWEHFLLLYANRVVPSEEPPEYQLLNVCKKATTFCPHYKVWRQYLSLCVSFKDKDSVSNEFLSAILNNVIQFDTEIETSHSILELVCYKLQLYLETGHKVRAHTFFRKYLLNHCKLGEKSFKSSLEVIQYLFENSTSLSEPIKSILGSRLTLPDKVYAWLCYIYLLYTGYLPFNIFETFGPSYCKLSSKQQFSIEWKYCLTSEKKSKLFFVFCLALKDCLDLSQQVNYESLTTTFPLIISLVTLDPFSNDVLRLFNYLQNHFTKASCLWILEAELLAQLGNYKGAIQTLRRSFGYHQNDINVLFLISRLSYESNDYQESFTELRKIVSSYFDREMKDSEMKSAFDLLMTDNSTISHPLRSHLKCKIIEKTNILDLCYL